MIRGLLCVLAVYALVAPKRKRNSQHIRCSSVSVYLCGCLYVLVAYVHSPNVQAMFWQHQNLIIMVNIWACKNFLLYQCVCLYVYLSVCACMPVCTFASLCICLLACMPACLFVCLCACVCPCVYVCVMFVPDCLPSRQQYQDIHDKSMTNLGQICDESAANLRQICVKLCQYFRAVNYCKECHETCTLLT